MCRERTNVRRTAGFAVPKAAIEFTEPRYAKRFSRFPFRHAVFDILPPDEAKAGDYDLVCLGSPTWFFTTCMPLRSYLRSDEARAVLAGTPFAPMWSAAGNARSRISPLPK